MKLFLKHKLAIVASVILVILYLFLRLVNLNSLPIFTDEAIYVRWAQIALNDSSWRFISLTDGKQPMFVWITVVIMKFISDPLLAGRLTSVISGLTSLIGIWLLTFELFKNKKTAFLAATLFVFYPFAQVLDRMALYDSMVGSFAVWAMYFSILLVRRLKLDLAYTLGFVIAGGILTKTSIFFNLYLLPFTLILFDFKNKYLGKRLFKWGLLALMAFAVSFGLYNILRLSPLFEMIRVKNALFIYPLTEWLAHPFEFFSGNLNGLTVWLTEYLTVFYLALIFIAVILLKKDFKEKILLIIYFLIPFVSLALFARIIFPRFIYFMSLFLLPLAAWGLNYLINKTSELIKVKTANAKIAIAVIVTAVFIAYPGFVCFQFAINPVDAAIAKADSNQYVNSTAAGWGVKESITFFKDQAKDKKIFIGTEGNFGLLPEAMEIYLINNKNITIKGYWPIEEFPKETLLYAQKMPTFLIFFQQRTAVIPQDYPLKLVFKIKQGHANSYYRVYQVIPR